MVREEVVAPLNVAPLSGPLDTAPFVIGLNVELPGAAPYHWYAVIQPVHAVVTLKLARDPVAT
jgi:hypothetical protein